MNNTALYEKLKTQIIEAFYRKAEKENLEQGIVNKCVADIQYIFSKDPEKKEDECYICED